MKKRILSTLLALSLTFSLVSAGSTAFAAGAKEINIFGIGDFGGKLDPVDSPTGDPGGAKIVGAMKALTAEAANPIVVTGGTNYTGSAISKLNHGTPVNEMYKAMGVKYVNIGNHDFDWSDDTNRETCFQTWQSEGGFTFLNANVYYTEGDKAGQRLFTPYAVEEVDGVKVGFFGVIDPGNYGAISSLNVKGLEFRDAAEESLEIVKALRNDEKCDVIVAMPHIASAQAKPDLDTPVGEGALTEYITELNAACKKAGVKGIDAAFASQCETAHLTVIDGVPLVKAKNFGQIIAQLSIKIDGDKVTVTPSLHPLTQQVIKDADKEESVLGSTENTRAEVPEDAEFKAVYDKYNDIAMKILDDPRGISDADFSEADPASKFAYQKWYLKQNWYYLNYVANEPVAAYFQNCGGIRHIDPTEVKVGDPISLRLIQKMAPFDNYLVTMDMTGKDIKALLGGKSQYGTYDSLKQYGLDVTYAAGEYEANGEVLSVKLNGKELDDETTYRIACNTFLSPGPGDNMDFSAGTNVKKYDVINSNAVLEAILDQSASLAELNVKDFAPTTYEYTSFVDNAATDAAVLSAKASNADAAVDVQGGALKVGANAVAVTVTAPYTDPNKTEGTVRKNYSVNLVRGYADEASIPTLTLPAVKAVTAAGLFCGDQNGNFNPSSPLDRNSLAVLLARAAKAEFSDAPYVLSAEVPAWAAPSMNWCLKNGLLTADTGAVDAAVLNGALSALTAKLGLTADVAPIANVTRADVAAALSELLGLYKVQAITAPALTEIDKYGDIRLSVTAGDFEAMGFEYADYATVKFLDQELKLPVIPEYRYVGAKGAAIVMWRDGSKSVELEVFNGSFAETYGLAKKITEDGQWHYEAMEGVEFPVTMTIEVSEKGGYADTYAIFDLIRTDDRADYADLTDEQFANFREVTTTGMGEGKLYRASSPANPSIGRNTYADAAAKACGVKSFVNLADSAEGAAKYEGYADSYYSKQNVKFLNLGVDFTTEVNRQGVAEAMRFIATAPTPVLVHCNEGQDRAGFLSAVLECLMGATFDEVEADYMTTFTNYYGVQPGTTQYEQIANNIAKNLKTAFQVEDITTADLADEAEAYLKELGVTDAEIAAVRANLGA